MKRLSIVGTIKINGMLFSSLLQIGDNAIIEAQSRVFAVQRETARFWGREGRFDMYPIFTRPVPRPPEWDEVAMSVDNLGSFIQVGHVRILSLSTSAIMQVGSNRVIQAESRVKNIRQFTTPLQGNIGESPVATTEQAERAKDSQIRADGD
jgi:spore germination protein PE